MTLATIALFSVILGAAPAHPLPPGTLAGQSVGQSSGQSNPQSPPASQPDATQTQSQDSATQTTTPPPATSPQPPKKPSTTAKPSTKSAPASATAAKRPRRKKVTNVNCVPAPAAATGSPASSADPPAAATPPASSAPPAGTAAPGTAASTAPTNCPPSKIIVRQGGTSEPSIHLAGGPGGDQADLRRHTARLLGVADENLKKIAGRQLSQDQQNIVAQIHQFTDQSKTAAAAGDLERADTLAMKAQLLSEELVKPLK